MLEYSNAFTHALHQNIRTIESPTWSQDDLRVQIEVKGMPVDASKQKTNYVTDSGRWGACMQTWGTQGDTEQLCDKYSGRKDERRKDERRKDVHRRVPVQIGIIHERDVNRAPGLQ